jgi:FkbM family methyltransferase
MKVRNFTMCLDTEDKGMSTQLLAGGGWEGVGPDILEALIEPGMTVVDMGACIGFYTLLAAACGARVYAIEADADNVRILRRAVEVNGFGNVKVSHMAIAAEDGIGRFDPSPGRSDRGRLSAEGTEAVRTITLDTYVERLGIEQVDVLRCDIESAETGMVAGGQTTLAAMRPGSWIYIDLHPRKLSDPMDLKPAVESILEHGFVPECVLGGGVKLGTKSFVDDICRSEGFPKVFLRKCASDT